MPRVAIALGSNLGDRHRTLAVAVERLRMLIPDLTVSESVETEPEGKGLDTQPLYVNAAAVGTCPLSARELLDGLMAIESACGRERTYPGAPRTLDLDLILHGDTIVESPGLQIPHPRFRARFFVLGPLAEIASGMADPVTGKTVGELLRKLLRDEER